MTKPIHTNLTQEQRNTCVAAAIKSGVKLGEWAGDNLLRIAENQLYLQTLTDYIDQSEKGGYESVMLDIEKAKWLLNIAKKATNND